MSDTTDKTTITERPQAASAVVRKIGHYEVVAELGRGGMGTVLRAYEPSLNRYVAIKVLATHLADDAALVGRFAREAKAVAALNHPNIVHIYYTGETEGLPYFVMECIEGETLADLIRQQSTLMPKEAAQLLLAAASGLAAAHDRGIIHRDIKPSNLMIDTTGLLKITDFGIAQARDMGDKLTTTGQIVGTTGYVSPEVFKGYPVDSRSDIFSLGIVLYEMLVGTSPFDDPSPMGLMLQVVEQPVPDVRRLNPVVDQPLADILNRMTEKAPEQRYQTCHELADDLKRYLAGKPLGAASAASVVAVTPMPVSERRAFWPVLLLLLVVSLAGAAWWAKPYWGETDVPAEANSIQDTDSPVAENLAMAMPAMDSPAEETQTAVNNQPVGSAADEAATPDGMAIAANGVGSGSDDKATASLQTSSHPEPVVDDSKQLMGDSVTDPMNSPTGKPIDSPMNDLPPVAASNTAPETRLKTAALSPAPELHTSAKPAPVIAPVPAAMIAVRGDLALTGPVEQQLVAALQNAGFTLVDPAFIADMDNELAAASVNLARIGPRILNEGAGFLVVATVTPLAAEALEYFGQVDTLYTSRLEIRGYDLAKKRSLGNWSDEVRYTGLNAAERAETAAGPLVEALVGALPEATD